MVEHISWQDWKRERLIWIAFEKNNDNDECLFGLLPKDIILEIIKFFKTDLRLDNFTRTDYRNYDDQQLSKSKDRNDTDVETNGVEKNDKIDKNAISLTIATRQEENEKQNAKFHCCCWKR